MKEPNSPEEILELHKILRSDPQRYLKIVSRWIEVNPKNANAFYDRHFGWIQIGEPLQALEDLNRVVELDPDPATLKARGDVYRYLGNYEKALEDYDRAETMEPSQWNSFGILYQADCYARLGDLTAALAYCSRLPDDHWTPGMQGAPAGDKAAVADALRRIAAEARRNRMK